MLQNSTYKLYSDRSMLTDWTSHTNTQDILILDKTIKEEYLTDAAIPTSHSFHSIITEKLHKYTDLKE
jgi:hypothetical protein